MKIHREELAWAAGFFDGEGYIGAVKRGHGTLQLVVVQVDRRVLDRFQAAVGVGTIYGPKILGGNRQPRYNYRVADFAGVQAVVAMLWHWLSPVKRAQAVAAFTEYKSRDNRPWRSSICHKGHSRAHSTSRTVLHKNGRTYVHRRCLLCFREYIRDYMRQERARRKFAIALLSA